jgi:hypothetical protein
MTFMSGFRDKVPLYSMLVMARVVSKSNSMTASFTPATRLRQQLGTLGWKKTADFRRLISANTGSNNGSPGHFVPVLLKSETPSHLSVSNAYSISLRLASRSIRGSAAKKPNCFG